MANSKNIGRDRGRISSQRHEVSYAGAKLGEGGASRVREAKRALGRTTSRRTVMSKARRRSAAPRARAARMTFTLPTEPVAVIAEGRSYSVGVGCLGDGAWAITAIYGDGSNGQMRLSRVYRSEAAIRAALRAGGEAESDDPWAAPLIAALAGRYGAAATA